jgi:predicted lipase
MTDDYIKLRWDIVNKLFNEFDKVLSKLKDEENMTVFEVQTSLLMITEKIEQQKFIVYSLCLKDEQDATTPSGMYS